MWNFIFVILSLVSLSLAVISEGVRRYANKKYKPFMECNATFMQAVFFIISVIFMILAAITS